MSETTGIEVVHVHKAYEQGRIQALAGMNLHVSPGEYVALVGPSGCWNAAPSDRGARPA